MSLAYDILTAFKISVDGQSVNGEGEKATLPKIVAKTEEYNGAGTLAPIDVPMGQLEKMEFECTFNSFSPVNLGAVSVLPNNSIDVVLRGNVSQSSGVQVPATARMRGVIIECDADEFEPGKKVQVKLKMSLHYYKLSVAGATVVEADVNNYIYSRNGQDQLAGVRANLGI